MDTTSVASALAASEFFLSSQHAKSFSGKSGARGRRAERDQKAAEFQKTVRAAIETLDALYDQRRKIKKRLKDVEADLQLREEELRKSMEKMGVGTVSGDNFTLRLTTKSVAKRLTKAEKADKISRVLTSNGIRNAHEVTSQIMNVKGDEIEKTALTRVS